MRRLLLPLLSALACPALAAQDPRQTSSEGSQDLFVQLLDHTRPVERRGAGGPEGAFVSVDEAPEGDMPREVAFRPDGSEAVIVHRDTGLVAFFDVASHAITSSVSVGDHPVHVAVTPDDRWAVVPNVFSNTLSVLDLALHAKVADVPLSGEQPYRVAVTSDSRYAVVGLIGDGASSSVAVVDLLFLQEVRHFPTTPQGVYGTFVSGEAGISGDLFTEFALAPDDVTLLLPDRSGDRLALYDVTTGLATAMLATGHLPTRVDVSADGTVAVVADASGAVRLDVVDLSVPAVVASYATGSTAADPRVRLTPDGVYAALTTQNGVQFVELATGTVATTLQTGAAGDLELSFDGAYLLVPNANFAIVDLATRTIVKTLPYAPAAEAAASPVEHRCVALNNRFREDVQLYATGGAAGAFEAAVLSGPPREGDAPRTLALTPDGALAVVASNTGDDALLVDLALSQVRAHVPTGARSLGVAVSPDGSTALVANGGDDTLSVIDLASEQVVAQLAVPSVPAEVLFAPDGTEAWVASVGGADRLHLVRVDGAASAVVGSLDVGQMGSILATYGVFSGLALSPDGETLAVCASIDDALVLVDTAARAVVATVPVGDFPVRAVFGPKGDHVYVTLALGDALVDVRDHPPGGWAVAGSVPVPFPLQVSLDEAGDFAYVGAFEPSDPHVAVVDTQSMTLVGKVALPGPPRSQVAVEPGLFVSLANGALARVSMAGASSALLELVPLAGSPSDLAFDPRHGVAVTCEPGIADGLDVVRFGGAFERYCSPAVPNSTGQAGTMDVLGTLLAGGYPLELVMTQLPPDRFGTFMVAPAQDFIPFAGGSQGTLCLGAPIARWQDQLKSSGPEGMVALTIDTEHLPFHPSVAIQAGETWYFQGWYRDKNPLLTSNFTDAAALAFE